MSYDWIERGIQPGVVVEDQRSVLFGAKIYFSQFNVWFFADFPVILACYKDSLKYLSTLSAGFWRSIKFKWFDWVRKLMNLTELLQNFFGSIVFDYRT